MSNLWRKFESIVKPWQIVAVFILILLFGLYHEGHAEEVVNVEVGPTFLSGEFSQGAILVLNSTWDDRWRVGMGVVAPQEVTDRYNNFHEVNENLFVHGQRIVEITPKIDLGLGVGYFNALTRWNGSHFVASMSVEYELSKNWSLNYRHWSNAGSASPNMGQDAFTIGYSFE